MSASATPRPSKRAGQQPRPSSIRETVFEDYPRIAALHARHGVASKSEHEWVTQWITNPAYDGQPIGWVVEAANGEIVGSVASLAAAYYLRGRKLRAAVAGDWAVDSQYRGYSLQLMARLMIQEHADIVLTTTASPNAEAVLATFGWRRAPVGSWNKVAFWVTDHRGFAKAALTAMSVPFASAVSYPLASALSIGTCLNRAHFQKVLSCAAPQPCTRFDDRFDTLWEELKVQNEGVLLGCRTRQALAWHFRNAKPGENCWILTA